MSTSTVKGSKNGASLNSNKKHTIANLFSTREQKSSRADDSSASSFSPNKKLKRSDGSEIYVAVDNPATTFKPVPLQDMYNFPGKAAASSSSTSATNKTAIGNASNGNVVDLTRNDDVTASSSGQTQQKKKMKECSNVVNGRSGNTRNGFPRPQNPNFTPHTGAKKIQVKNLRINSKSDPRQYYERVWGQLRSALGAIIKGEKVASLEELYRAVNHVCLQGFSSDLAEKLKDNLENYVSVSLRKDVVAKAEAITNAKGPEAEIDVLRLVLEAWDTWKEQMRTVQWIFLYLDRSYLIHAPDSSIDELSINLFREHIFKEPFLKSKIIDGACKLIGVDRSGYGMDQARFRKAVDLFHQLLVYTEYFEPRMLDFSQTFIVQWSEQAVADKSLKGYVASCFKLMESESQRCITFDLDSTTRRELMTLIEHHLIERQESFLTNEYAVAALLSDDSIESLKSLYELLQIRGLGVKLKPAFEKWIDSTGSAIVFDEDRENDMVVRLLVLKKQLDRIWRVSFKKHTELGHCLRETFEAFINRQKKSKATWGTDNSKPEEMIAKYVDLLMRGGSKSIPESLATMTMGDKGEIDENADKGVDEEGEINKQLDQVLDLFRFIHGKAVFEAFYKKDLARRLLMDRSASADAERSMLLRLKTECGAGFTQNLEIMFKDIELAREEMVSYRTFMEGRNERLPFDFNVNILSAAAWPPYPHKPVIIPPDIQKVHDRFKNHYKSKHGNRDLDWKHAPARCLLRASFAKGMKELVVSSFQALVLLLFNDVGPNESLTYENILAMTGLSEEEAKRTLQSVACAKYRLLTKKPKSQEINAKDVFIFNELFWDKRFRIKINTIQLGETKEENKETHERVAMDRNFETQAAIVRIMKSRKTITHAELVAEVIQATKTRGVLSVTDIKKNIDSLIEKDYMEREEGTNSYNYIS